MTRVSLSSPWSFTPRVRPVNNFQAVPEPTEPRPSTITGLSVDDLGEFLGMGDALPASERAVLDGFLQASIERAVQFTGYEPANRAYTFRFDAHPAILRGRGGAGLMPEQLAPWAMLPRRPVDAVNEVRVAGGSVPFEADTVSNPPRVQFDLSAVTGVEMAVIEIDTIIGPGDVQSPDPRFVTAVLMLAAYLYENRGCSDTGSALASSGAMTMLKGLRVRTGGL